MEWHNALTNEAYTILLLNMIENMIMEEVINVDFKNRKKLKL